jgi:hypothetical protein
MVRIHARQPSSPIADLRAICDLQKLNAKIAVIWLLSGFEVLLMLSGSICADNGAFKVAFKFAKFTGFARIR